MRVQCGSLADFVENLKSGKVDRDAVYVERSSRPFNQDGSVEEIFFQGSAIVVYENGDRILIQCGINCGLDNRTSGGELIGSETANNLCESIAEYTDNEGWRLLPGLLEE